MPLSEAKSREVRAVELNRKAPEKSAVRKKISGRFASTAGFEIFPPNSEARTRFLPSGFVFLTSRARAKSRKKKSWVRPSSRKRQQTDRFATPQADQNIHERTTARTKKYHTKHAAPPDKTRNTPERTHPPPLNRTTKNNERAPRNASARTALAPSSLVYTKKTNGRPNSTDEFRLLPVRWSLSPARNA